MGLKCFIAVLMVCLSVACGNREDAGQLTFEDAAHVPGAQLWTGVFIRDVARGCDDRSRAWPLAIQVFPNGRAQFADGDTHAAWNDWTWRQHGRTVRIDTIQLPGDYFEGSLENGNNLTGLFFTDGCRGRFQLYLQ